MSELQDWVVEQAHDKTDGDGPWTSVNRLRAEARKTDRFDKGDVKDAVLELNEADRLLYWHGLVAPVEAPILRAIVTREVEERSERRMTLIKTCNRLLNDLRDQNEA